MDILVTGATGVLGRRLVPRLVEAGHRVRAMSRRAPPETPGPGVVWAQADLDTGQGVREAVRGAEVIVHGASNPLRSRRTDVLGTERLASEARAAGVAHLICVSIVGIDRIPLGYYRGKLAAERRIEGAGVPWSVLRATQFHTLIDMALKALMRWPIALLPTDFRFQPIDPSEVATRLVEIVAAGPSGRLPDIGGPEVQQTGALAQTWLAARGRRRRLFRLPLPGRVAAGYRNGYNTVPDGAYGRVTWADWVHRHH